MNKDSSKETKKKMSKKKAVLLVILVLLLAVFIVGAATVTHYINLINHVNDIDTVDPDKEFFDTDSNTDGEVVDPNKVTWDLSGPLGDEHLLNLLLVGQDKRPGEGRQRSDVMIVASINLETKSVSLISFMRDLYVQIPGYSDNRLNAAYVFGGFPLLKDTLYKNFGITIDGCFEVDFNGFIKSIDKIGGVDIVLSRAEANAIGVAYKGDEPTHLNGEKALSYARLRKIDSDFGRTDRQKKILLSAANKLKSCSVKELISLVNEVLPAITTDMSTTQIYSLVAKAAPLVASSEIKTFTVPGSGTYKNVVIRGMQVLLPDLEAVKKMLRESYMPF